MYQSSDGSVSLSDLQDAKKAMVKEFTNFCASFFGQPPTKFDWTFYAKKDKKFHAFRDLTPLVLSTRIIFAIYLIWTKRSP